MTPKRDASKLALRFHSAWLKFLLNASQQTMRRVCHEIAHLEKESRSYRDGVLFKLLRENLEFVIRDTSGSSWSIDKCRHDLGVARARGT